MSGPRIVVGGFLGLWPTGGVTWDYVQYPLGFAELGYDVYYVEDTRLWPVYDSESHSDCSNNVQHLKLVMEAFGLEERWAYRDEVTGTCFGMSESQVKDVCSTADVFVNVSCSTYPRDEYLDIPVRVLIDTDPMFTQIQLATEVMLTTGERSLPKMVESHTNHFTFGENIGSSNCRMPTCGIKWLPTRQPICMEWWPRSHLPTDGEAAYTTVMNWSAARPLDYESESWGQKNIEFHRFMSIPEHVPDLPLAIAVGQTRGRPFPSTEARRKGWRVLEPEKCVPDWRSYRRFIQASKGEFSVAKETYVKGGTGWFSCRSACYLATGRPVVLQDTGWSRNLPNGEGLFPFHDRDSAVEALRRIESDPPRHSRTARRIAEEHFDSRVVLKELLARC